MTNPVLNKVEEKIREIEKTMIRILEQAEAEKLEIQRAADRDILAWKVALDVLTELKKQAEAEAQREPSSWKPLAQLEGQASTAPPAPLGGKKKDKRTREERVAAGEYVRPYTHRNKNGRLTNRPVGTREPLTLTVEDETG